MGSGDEALELPEGVELKIKNEDFLFVEWRDNKFHKNEKETNCNVVQLLYEWKLGKEEAEKKLKRKPYFGFKITLEANYGEYKGLDVLDKLLRDANWFLCASAYELVNIPDSQQQQQQQQPGGDKDSKDPKDVKDKEAHNTSLLLMSKLFSGGIEERHYSSLSPDASAKLKIFKEYNAAPLDELLDGGAPGGVGGGMIDMDLDGMLLESEDAVFAGLLERGKHEGVESLVGALQQEFVKKVAWGGVGGLEAEGLVRDSFAVMIKLSGLGNELAQMVTAGETGGVEAIRASAKWELVCQKWTAASRMRTWWAEKKKNVAEAVKGEDAEREELEKVRLRIKGKAEFLLKVKRPSVWQIGEGAASSSSSSAAGKPGATVLVRTNKAELAQEDTKETWKKQLHQWHYMQRSAGVIKSFEAQQAEVFSSLTSSVLSCLQSSIHARRIQKQIETSYVQAARRNAGLKMLAQALAVNTPLETFLDGVAWFCAGLRHNENALTHYTKGVRVAGLEDDARAQFFSIIKQVLARLPEAENDGQLKNLLDALKWQYVAADHVGLSEL